VWEIDQLLLPEGEESLGATLLENLGLHSAKIGAHKIFLRIERDDHMVDAARQAGFFLRGTEYLYCLENPSGRDLPNFPALTLRAKTSSDEYHLFQLYTAATPPTLRHAEGMTLQEWQASREKSRGEEFLCQKRDSIVGWLRLYMVRSVGIFELLTLPSEENLEEILTEYSLAKLSRASVACCIAQEHQLGLRRVFTRKGFQLSAEYSVMLKQLAVAVPQPSLAPLQA
jgi:hypothetical protein